jgi:hypothetical protein
MGRWAVWVSLCVLAAACGAQGPTATAEPKQIPTVPSTLSPEPTAALATPAPSATSTPSPPPPATLTPSPQPFTVTPSPNPDSWYGSRTVLLFVSGVIDQADLFAYGDDGTTWLVFPDVGDELCVSPDGRWLGFVRWGDDGRATLELHDAQAGDRRQITVDTTSGLLRFSFDRDSRRLAYLDLGAYTDAGVPWALVVVDLETGAMARYEARMTDNETRPLPGMPVGWSGLAPQRDELIIDTFLPFTEGGWMGVWGVTLSADGASAPLDSLALRELLPGAPVYQSKLYVAPDGRDLAFLGRDPDYFPDKYEPQFYDLAVNRLGLAAISDGARSTVVEVSDGSALASALAWSPSGERLLFAQGHYEGENFVRLSLKSSDQSGTVVEYGPLVLPPLGGLLDLAWCGASRAFYVTWDGGTGTKNLHLFDLNTGVSTDIIADQRLEIVGCAP